VPAIQGEDVAALSLPFSAGYRAGDFVFVSGQIASGADGTVLTGDFDAEVNLALDNIETILKSAGAGFSNVVKINAWLSNSLLFTRFNELYRERFLDAPPARTTVVVAFAHTDVRVEIDAIAYLGE
jgi:2-iminobutanoate/2-iminopropanoate deaminase